MITMILCRDSGQVFDPRAGVWRAGPSMLTARSAHCTAVVPAGPGGGMLLAIGGTDLSRSLASVEWYVSCHMYANMKHANIKHANIKY
jgi:hypothetical protein